jgi:hypothetical protein
VQSEGDDVNGEIVSLRFQFVRNLARVTPAIFFAICEQDDDSGFPGIIQRRGCGIDRRRERGLALGRRFIDGRQDLFRSIRVRRDF